ncbi:hypothetical protein HETIRDRAFT_454569 [Heterobasidion irregulare TC 32-1]|uniref:Uncharacterized protein n=1 Tax=Heterobasidion irregulare (strain TC 32-1) TaxID=747525 RepID=W4JUI7_HETIT|nr:uncharacterized protein HETIRDRAFT_454569 [Heterobasidion irregulare TC 32-1]ETW77218.1 hypothetical protein HETIRDRAFT_454569 [Heterobasidion irregulare TC 32-1]
MADLPTDVLQLYATHPFDSDELYQQGLSSIISNDALAATPDEEKEALLRRTRIFYFEKIKGLTISEDEARRAEELYAKPTNMSPDTSALQAPSEFGEEQGKEPRHLSFAELKTLIEQGRTDEIPYNKQIPDKLNDAPPSTSTVPQRRKPWELGTAQAAESS